MAYLRVLPDVWVPRGGCRFADVCRWLVPLLLTLLSGAAAGEADVRLIGEAVSVIQAVSAFWERAGRTDHAGVRPSYALRGCSRALVARSKLRQLHVRRLLLAAIIGC
jgi:hypothetical protein